MKIEEAIKEAEQWINYAGVEGVAQGKKAKKDCILVFISCPKSMFDEKIPKEFKGFAVVLQESGDIAIQ